MINTGKLAGLTVFITGGSRGIGKAIALKAAKDGANVVVAAKTAEPHPKLPGTIYSACEEIEKAGGKGLACIVDVRDETTVKKAVEDAVKKFGGIDIVVNNASAISLTDTAGTDMKRYDLMHNINTRGTFLVTKECLPYLKKSNHAHVLNISPPLSMLSVWFKSHVAYTMAKFGMSMCVLGHHEEFRPFNIAVNALWPRKAVDTAAMQMIAGAESSQSFSRKPDIMADSAYVILCKDPKVFTGKFCIDDDVLREAGATEEDIRNYACIPANADNLLDDSFVEEALKNKKDDENAKAPTGRIAGLFKKIEGAISTQVVGKTQAIFNFNVTGEESGPWYLDLKNGDGACGQGLAPQKADATLTMDSKHFLDMFAGKTKPAMAFLSGKLKIEGDLSKATKLENLMGSLKAKL